MISPTDKFIEQVNECTHAPTQTEGKVTQIKANVKQKAEAIVDMSTLRRNIRKAHEDLNMQPNPETQEVIPMLPAEYQVTDNNGQCLIFDSGVGDQK